MTASPADPLAASPAAARPVREALVRASTSRDPATGRRPDAGSAASGESFRAVLAAARVGSEWAWSELYRGLAPTVLGYLRARGAPEPEDVAGEVFLQAVRDLQRFDGDERALRAWLLTIAHHRLLDARRRRARRPVEPAPDDVLDARSPTGDAEQEALRSLDLAEVRALLSGLSADQESVLVLRIVGDLTVEEVARVLGKRTGAVKALQRRGLLALQQGLSDE